MEHISLNLDDPGKFDQIIKNSLPDHGDLSVITKDSATMEGNPAVMLSFTVTLPDGKIATAQTVTTMKLFLSSLSALTAKYGHLIR